MHRVTPMYQWTMFQYCSLDISPYINNDYSSFTFIMDSVTQIHHYSNNNLHPLVTEYGRFLLILKIIITEFQFGKV